jgi:hypothetical protein
MEVNIQNQGQYLKLQLLGSNLARVDIQLFRS